MKKCCGKKKMKSKCHKFIAFSGKTIVSFWISEEIYNNYCQIKRWLSRNALNIIIYYRTLIH